MNGLPQMTTARHDIDAARRPGFTGFAGRCVFSLHASFRLSLRLLLP